MPIEHVYIVAKTDYDEFGIYGVFPFEDAARDLASRLSVKFAAEYDDLWDDAREYYRGKETFRLGVYRYPVGVAVDPYAVADDDSADPIAAYRRGVDEMSSND